MQISVSYRWVVVFAAMSVRTIVYGITYTSGIVYVIILQSFETGKAETSLITSLVTTVMLTAGPPSGRLLKAFGWRITAVGGGLVAGIGLLLSSLSSRLTFLILSYGFITGFGCGMTYMVAIVAVPAHFLGHPRQKIAVALASCGTGVGTFVFSPIIQVIDSTYGWRGLFVILAGVALQFCIIGLLFRPVSPSSSGTCDKMTATWNFMKNPGFYATHLGFFLTTFGDSVIFGHLGEYAETLGLTNAKGAYLYSIIGISVMILKLLQGAILDNRASVFMPMKLAILFFFLGGIATASLLISEEYSVLVIYSIFFGASNAANGGAVVVGLLETYYGYENLQLTLGMNLGVLGIGNLLGAPIAGALFESYKSYTPVLIMVSALKVLSSFLLLLVYKFCPQKHTVKSLEISSPKLETNSKIYFGEVVDSNADENSPLLMERNPPEYSRVVLENAYSELKIHEKEIPGRC